MGHHSARSAYEQFAQRINRYPTGAPPTELLFRILEMLVSEQEARAIAQLPIKPFTIKAAARTWKSSETEAHKILDGLASRGVLLDVERRGVSYYVLPPPMAGFFEFSLMRTRGDIDQKLLSELLHQYLHEEEDFVRALFGEGETRFGRTFVQEPALPPALSHEVMGYERASEVIRTARHIGLGLCYCRHKATHLGKACDAPQDICMTLNSTAASLNKHGITRSIEKSHALDLLQQAYDLGLVQFGDNVQRSVSFLCHCCGCCCEAMIAARKFAFLHPVQTTNFLPKIEDKNCTGCGKCVEVCPVAALGLVSAEDPANRKKKRAQLDEDVCLGCGVCVRRCTKDALKLEERAARVLTPVNTAQQAVLMAIERGKLADLLFDNRALHSHRAMAAVLGVLLKLPPVKQVMANKQLRSRYVERLFAKIQ
ncbi:MAG: 4Fe-4S dicluster domain-containing protein [Myxococcota bacterium]|jgi:ferredoxin|nr:4Fe-4S dicluster domain-containing protein [Myxococcota bacterium]